MEFYQEIIRAVFNQYGFFAMVYLLLLWYVLKENKIREEKYQNTISNNQDVILEQAKSFEIVKVMKDDIDDMKIIMLQKK